ncbi:hypothetical protein ACJA23_01665 [Mycoplasma corogypsi]|uniref:hypothetical protein n=1 Tax=Mycoplasma corogypsi TaxID=2106 RepID=UPI0038731E37
MANSLLLRDLHLDANTSVFFAALQNTFVNRKVFFKSANIKAMTAFIVIKTIMTIKNIKNIWKEKLSLF